MDKDKAAGIQKLVYPVNANITDGFRKYQFIIWAADFSQTNTPNGSLEVTSNTQMSNIFNDQNIAHQVFLRGDMKEDSSLTDEYDCLFFQVEFQIFTFVCVIVALILSTCVQKGFEIAQETPLETLVC